MDVLGGVVRLQVQRSRLKPGPRGARRYDPAPLLAVDALEVGPRGVTGLTADGPVPDVHHADHPDSRNEGLSNGLSLMPRAHYAALRARFGPHLADGVAGESLLLDTIGPWGENEVRGPLLLETDGGAVELTSVEPAPPCVEFTRFALGRTDTAVDDELRTALADLGGGARGFYATAAGSGMVRVGARLFTSLEGVATVPDLWTTK